MLDITYYICNNELTNLDIVFANHDTITRMNLLLSLTLLLCSCKSSAFEKGEISLLKHVIETVGKSYDKLSSLINGIIVLKKETVKCGRRAILHISHYTFE